ncbi:MAG: 7-carboxy-7-deazaguanine synthase QueE [Desulfomonilia bacterium]
MRVTEIFYSLQGEGPSIGLPAIFIRLCGCLEPYCPWCDTAYALDEYCEMESDAICTAISGFPTRIVVITGGEPFLQWGQGLSALHELLVEKDFEINYETSGRVLIPDLDNATVVCSPKYIDGSWRFHWSNIPRIDCFKFVAWDTDSLEAIDCFIARNTIPPERICIMPLGATRDEQLLTMELVFTYCRDRGYRMSTRLHILTFDARRGV